MIMITCIIVTVIVEGRISDAYVTVVVALIEITLINWFTISNKP
jgi:hypothetical protein